MFDGFTVARYNELEELENELAAKTTKLTSSTSDVNTLSNLEGRLEYEVFSSDQLGRLSAQDWICIAENSGLQKLNVDKCSLEKFEKYDWAELLFYQSCFADKCPFDDPWDH